MGLKSLCISNAAAWFGFPGDAINSGEQMLIQFQSEPPQIQLSIYIFICGVSRERNRRGRGGNEGRDPMKVRVQGRTKTQKTCDMNSAQPVAQ